MDVMEEEEEYTPKEYRDYLDEEEEELPPLNEGDEAISLYDILVERDKSLTEEELWALCRECCLVLEVVNNSPEMFQTLCVTPDTVAFDGAGNVCFLDLDRDPEPLYISPEYDNVGNSIKSHLFSLGMTLLYAAEYNGEPNQEICLELRELFGCMTSEHLDTRPDLESIITQCEEELCGKSSQEICCGIGGFAAPFTPAPDVSSVVNYTDITEGLNSYLNTQSLIIPSTDPEQQEEPQQHSTPTRSPSGKQEETGSVDDPEEDIENSEDVENEEDMPVRGMLTGMPLPTGNRERKNPPRGSNKQAFNFSSNLISSSSSDKLSKDVNLNVSEANEVLSDSRLSEDEPKVTVTAEIKTSVSPDKPKPPLPKKPSLKEPPVVKAESALELMDVGMPTDINKMKSGASSSTPKTGPVEAFTENKEPQGESLMDVSSSSSVKRTESSETSGSETKPKRSKKKQGLTINEVLDSLNRELTEEELWAVCREGMIALQRKKKHLPAYISPDTLVLRENGNLSFKAIPEDKPLEVIFMAPELQQRGKLSDKTCLYGLGVTLRCAGGKKYSPISAMTVSEEFKSLLEELVKSDPAERPSLETARLKCDNNEGRNSLPSNITCKNLFHESFTKMMNLTNNGTKELEAAEESVPEKPVEMPKPKPKPPPKPPSPMLSAFRPIKGPVIKPQIGSSSSVFAPVAVKPEGKVGMPSAFTSSATHFKPIILHKTGTSPPAEEKKVEEKKVEEKRVEDVKEQDGDNDKEVVRKLKELKKNLMKHRQPVKESEVEEKENQKEPQVTSAKSSSDNKKDLAEETVKTKAGNTGSLDNLLSELQKQGGVSDTQSLAAAIAQHLAKSLHGGQQQTNDQQGQGQMLGRQSHVAAATAPNMNQMFNMQLNQQMSNFPPQYQQQLMGQTMTLPPMGQFGGAMMPGYPMQVQLQQDPRTGLFQIVPVSMVTVSSAPGSQANSDEFTNMEDTTRMSDPGRSPKPRPRRSGNDASNSPTTLPKQKQGRHGRTAKDLVQKTANIRSKNLQQQNMPSISSLSGPKDYDSKQWSSNQDSEKLSSQNKAFNGEGELPSSQYNSLPRRQSVPHNSADYLLHPQSQRIRSNTSSPSPSKDSGVSGVNGVYKPPDPGSLMERLLNSNTSLTQQQKMGRLVHLLREEFAFDGYMENGVEDINMAEYVMSLGSLKWETFSSAITEKYSDMYWKVDLLVSLFEAVNGIKPAILNQSSMPNRNSMPPPDTRFKHADDPDGSSSSMSEANQEHPYRKNRTDKAFSNRTGDRLGSRPQSVNVLQANYDTSDSTDNEKMESRRRHRRKHMEKAKSSSMHNLASHAKGFSVASDADNGFPGGDTCIPNINAQTATAEDQNTQDVNRRLSLPHNGLSPRDSFHSSSGASPRGSHVQPNHLNDTPTKERSSDGGQDSPHLIHVQSQKSDISQHYRKNRNAAVEGSLSSRSSSISDIRGPTKLTRHLSQLSLSEEKQETLTPFKRNHILFHYAMMQLNMSKDLEKFLQDIDEENAERLQIQLASLDQQIMMERRTKRKTQVFFNKISDSHKNAKDQKTTVSKDLEEMSQKIRYLQLCRSHIEMLQTELASINPTFLFSLSAGVGEAPLRLKPQCDNPLLQFQTFREPQTGCEIQVVQAGTVEGLISYLFASTALSFGYVHQFFFGFRYFVSPASLMDFLTSRFAAISRSKARETNLQRLQRRVVDLLHFWVEGFYPVDFEDNEDLINSLQFFLEEQDIATFSEEGKKLQELLGLCMEGNSRDLLTSGIVGENVHVYKQNGSTKKISLADKIREWDTLKTVTNKGTRKDPACMKSGFSVCLEKRRNSHHMEEVYFPKTARRTDAFTLADYTSQCVAEQLTLIEQGIFQMTHPVHYLNSKALGVSVALTMSGARTPSIMRLNNMEDAAAPSGNSLFVSEISDDPAIERMIDHSRDISHWVAAEIVSCSSSKSQVAVLSKFLHAAQLCKEMRNYATCLAIADGLENIIIKQLPAWKNLPTKSYAVIEDLKSVRMFLKNDAMSLMKHADSHLYPTIPSALLFLLHVQQQEIGSFKLANDMVKWSKIRSIAQTVDQIRVFKDQMYGFEADYEMQDTLMQRVREFSSQDIQSIAAQHDTNYHKMPSGGGGITAAFRKMKGKFQSK